MRDRTEIAERIREMNEWSKRLERLNEPLTGEDWARLRLELRKECANHPKTDPLYGMAEDCEHDVPHEDIDYEDDLHVWGDEWMLCLAKVAAYACICQDGYCSQESSAREARDDLWYAVSLTARRTRLARHLSDAVSDVWLSTELTLEQSQDIAAECATEDEFRARVAAIREQVK